jgi:hypothetical protein
MTSQIVKVQRPLSTNDPVPQALVYGRNRYEQELQPMTELPAHIQARLKVRAKLYCLATWSSEDEHWTLGELTPDQPW